MATGLEEIYNALTPQQKAAIDARIAELAGYEAQLRSSVVTLRQWASDARGTTVTSGNAVATLQVVVNRMGAFFDRFADLLVLMGRDL